MSRIGTSHWSQLSFGSDRDLQRPYRWRRIKRNPSCRISAEMHQPCGTSSPCYRCFRPTQADIAGRHALSARTVRPPGRWRYKAPGAHPKLLRHFDCRHVARPQHGLRYPIWIRRVPQAGRPDDHGQQQQLAPHACAMQTWGHRHASDLPDLEKEPNMPNSARPLGREASRACWYT
jgi:hypothetical protein